MATVSKQDRGQITYADAGVSTAEGARAVDAIRAAVKSTNREEVIGSIGGFGGFFSAAKLKEMEEPILVSGTDGVGTKLMLAKRLGVHGTVGIDLVAMCVNDVVVVGAEPLFFLDYIAIGKLETELVSTIVDGIADGCRQAGCALVGGEMAEHPGAMDPDDYDLSGFCVGVVDAPKAIGPELVREGDAIIGLASSGVHSNGFSLVRKAFADTLTDEELNAPCEAFGGLSAGMALLQPTRIYVKPLLNALKEGLPIHACAHITGGGITENLDRALPKGLDARVELGTWPVLPIIKRVVDAASLSSAEALKTFNCGVGMCIICPADSADDVMEFFAQAGETPYRIGKIVAAQDAEAKGKVVYANADAEIFA